MADVDAATDEPQGHEPRPRRVWPWLVGVLALGVGVGVAAVLLISGNGDNSPHVAASAKPVGRDRLSATTSTTEPVSTTTLASPSGNGAAHGGPSVTPPNGNGSAQTDSGGNAGGTGTGAGGTTTGSSTPAPTVPETPAPYITQASAAPGAIYCSSSSASQNETISWATQNATSVHLSDAAFADQAQLPNGNVIISDACASNSVTITATGPGGSTSATVYWEYLNARPR